MDHISIISTTRLQKLNLSHRAFCKKKYDEIDIIRFVMANQIHILPIQRATSYLGSLIKSNAGEIKYENYIQWYICKLKPHLSDCCLNKSEQKVVINYLWFRAILFKKECDKRHECIKDTTSNVRDSKKNETRVENARIFI